jgi:HPt (histidine-containing phosphotransfer) domain-containing protein
MELPGKITNLDYLNELSKGDPAFINEMVTIFLTENPEEVRILEEAIKEKNYETIKSMSHHMKSTIPFVGIDVIIGKDLTDIEKLAEEKTGIEAIQTLFKNVKQTCEQAFEELNPQTL